MDSTSQLRVEAGASVHHGQYEEAMHQEVTSLCRAGGSHCHQGRCCITSSAGGGGYLEFGALGPLWRGWLGPGLVVALTD